MRSAIGGILLGLFGLACAAREPVPLRTAPSTAQPAVVAAAPVPATSPATAPARVLTPFIFHLPGVAGTCPLDYTLRDGLRLAGLDGPFEICDWTCNDPGIPALHARARNLEQARMIGQKITAQFRMHPQRPIIVTCHSGGSGPAVWALESLPEDVVVDRLVMLAPALSPGYDLSKALKHVRFNAYCFYSEIDDAVLGLGTRLFGTIDGVRGESAGKVGFTVPPAGDEVQYKKLIQRPYERSWARLGHIGGHLGWMSSAFARAILGPLMLGRQPTEGDLQAALPLVRPPVDVVLPRGRKNDE